ncbi:hypothetical protein ACDA63_07800 [Uliginosibacterium sp. sgz301328]|uniref:tetratricopeptide repeat protein n=1 Tax=Uliginosibacterium sp. sgz301328 TaxID=3243764 RepID=UPI00359E5C1F
MTSDDIVGAGDALGPAERAIVARAEGLTIEQSLSLLDEYRASPDRAQVAAALARRLTERFTDDGRVWYAYGRALQCRDAGHPEIARAFRRARQLGASVELMACVELEKSLRERGRYAEAEDVFPSVLPCGAGTASELNNLAVAWMDQNQGNDAFWLMLRAANVSPDEVVRRNLSRVIEHAERSPEVLDALRRVVERYPDDHYLLLGLLKRELFEGLYDEARATYQLLMEGDSTDPDRALAQAEALRYFHQPEQAVAIADAAYRHANGARAELGVLLADALWDCGRHDESVALLEDQHRRMADDVMTQLMLGEGQLRRGDWAAGWANMEALWRQPGWPAGRQRIEDVLGVPLWQGQSLAGKTLFVWQELQLGDGIWLARYLPAVAEHVKALGGQVMFAGWRNEYGRLLTRCAEYHSIQVLDLQSAEELDGFHLPMMSCCRAFGFTDATVPILPYMPVDCRAVDAWAARLERRPGRREVGLVWRGSRFHRRDYWRSMPVDVVARLCDMPNVRFHSINPASNAEAAALRAAGCDVVDWSDALPDFDATASLLCVLDQLVSVDTSVVHLAGSLGVPTLLMVDRGNAYLWGVEEGERTWYDSVRVIRQARIGDWSDVVQRVQASLAAGPA